MKIAFFEIKKWEREYIEGKLSDHQLFFFEQNLNLEDLRGDFEILSIFTSSKVDQEVIDKLQNLKFIATRSTGFDHIDLNKTTEKNILVSNIPTYGEVTVAEYTFAMLLSLSRKIHLSYSQAKNKDFSTDKLQGFDLYRKTIGIIGTGHIGVNVIKIAKGFHMKILAFDAYPNQNLTTGLGFEYVDLETLLKESDIVSLHVPYLPSTHHLINRKNISLMKSSAVIINTARGAVLETDALFDALKDKKIAGAALDVLEEEIELKNKLSKKSELADEIVKEDIEFLQMENVLITPHNAFNTKEAITRILDTTVENIKSFLTGHPKNVITLKKP